MGVKNMTRAPKIIESLLLSSRKTWFIIVTKCKVQHKETTKIVLDVHFDNQVLRLASVNCEAEILLKIVLQKKIDLASATASVDISQIPTKIARIGESHQYFACILRNHGDEGLRLIEDFEVIRDLDGEKCYLEIKECPLKYEMFRRPTLVFKRELSFVNSKDYDGSTNHDIFMHRCILKSDQELRISARLNWTLGLNNWKKADFLLKSDPKLGGVLMYNTSSSGKITSHQEESSQIGFFILSECDIHFRLPKHSKKTSTYQIIFKPNQTSKPNHDYLSINKEQTLKAIALESRSDFVTWMSALRLAKYGGDELSLAYKNCLMPPAPSIGGLAGEKNCSLASNNFFPAADASAKAQSSFKTKAIMDLHKVKGLNQILKLKTKTSNIQTRTRESSLSWSESISSLSQINSSRTSQLSLMNSDSDCSSTNSSSFMLKKPKQFSAMLSDVPHDSETEFGADPYEIEDDLEEEPDFVPIDMSAKGGCEIITDPNLIRQIETESAFKSKFRSIKSVPFSEPWFTKKSKLQVEQLLYNNFHVDGYFLVNPDYSKENNSVVALYLSVMCSDVLHQFKIVQVKSDARYFIVNIFCPCDFCRLFVKFLFCFANLSYKKL